MLLEADLIETRISANGRLNITGRSLQNSLQMKADEPFTAHQPGMFLRGARLAIRCGQSATALRGAVQFTTQEPPQGLDAVGSPAPK